MDAVCQFCGAKHWLAVILYMDIGRQGQGTGRKGREGKGKLTFLVFVHIQNAVVGDQENHIV